MMRFFLLTALFGIGFLQSTPVAAQRRYIIGKVLDDSTGQGVDNASVTGEQLRSAARTNRLGAYYLLTQPGDSIHVTSQTHGKGAFRWDGVTREPVLKLKRQFPDDDATLLPEVTVTSKRELQIRRELEQILREPKASKKLSGDEILNLADSPISLLYELFSRQARSRRKAAVLSQQYRRHRLADYRLDLLIGQATMLKGPDIDAFKAYCRFPDDYVLESSEYDLTYEILQRLPLFRPRN